MQTEGKLNPLKITGPQTSYNQPDTSARALLPQQLGGTLPGMLGTSKIVLPDGTIKSTQLRRTSLASPTQLNVVITQNNAGTVTSPTIIVAIPQALQNLDCTTPGTPQTGYSSADQLIRSIFRARCFTGGRDDPYDIGIVLAIFEETRYSTLSGVPPSEGYLIYTAKRGIGGGEPYRIPLGDAQVYDTDYFDSPEPRAGQ